MEVNNALAIEPGTPFAGTCLKKGLESLICGHITSSVFTRLEHCSFVLSDNGSYRNEQREAFRALRRACLPLVPYKRGRRCDVGLFGGRIWSEQEEISWQRQRSAGSYRSSVHFRYS
jgi:hypothetical protein